MTYAGRPRRIAVLFFWLAPACALFLACGLAAAPLGTVRAADPPPRVAAERAVAPDAVAVPGEVVVRYRPGVAPVERQRARARAAVELAERLELPRAELVEVEGSVQAAIRRLERQPGVAFAQPNYRYQALADPPNDTFFGELWGLSAPQGFGVNVLPAWDVSRGNGVTIAVLDTGVDLTHPDLEGNLWHNPGETKNGADSDGNGKVDDVHGYDFIDDNGDPDDYQFHGTHVAGTAAAIADNGFGIAGVAPEAKIMSVRVLDGNGSGTSAGIAEGISYAAQEGAGVLNLSLGGPAGAGDSVVASAVDIAAAHGAIVVAAAGNDGTDNDSKPTTPCTLPNANLICVAAINQGGGLASFSNFGATTVDVGAPGTNILSAKADYGSPLFDEDFESGYAEWETAIANGGVPWGPSSDPSGNNHVTDSPGGNYGSAVDPSKLAISELSTVSPVDLSSDRGCRLHFRTRYQIQPPAKSGALFDAFIVGAAENADLSDLRVFAGTSPGFSNEETFVGREASISKLDGRNGVEPLFAILSDDSVELDGAYVDDIRLICRDSSYVDAITPIQTYDQPDVGNSVAFNGTSMATPHVAGIAALVRSVAPSASPQAIVSAIRAGVRPLPALSGKTVTGGTADAALALGAILSLPQAPPTVGSDPLSVPQSVPPAAVDRTRPRAFFRQRPPRIVRTRFQRARVVFRFGSNKQGVRFVCRLNGGPWRYCRARFVKRLRVGRHVVRVKARDAAGNVTRRPAIHRFRIVRVGSR